MCVHTHIYLFFCVNTHIRVYTTRVITSAKALNYGWKCCVLINDFLNAVVYNIKWNKYVIMYFHLVRDELMRTLRCSHMLICTSWFKIMSPTIKAAAQLMSKLSYRYAPIRAACSWQRMVGIWVDVAPGCGCEAAELLAAEAEPSKRKQPFILAPLLKREPCNDHYFRHCVLKRTCDWKVYFCSFLY